MPAAVAPWHGQQASPIPDSYAFQQAPPQVIGSTINDAVESLWEHMWIGS